MGPEGNFDPLAPQRDVHLGPDLLRVQIQLAEAGSQGNPIA
jgi:hypothetical protein